MARKRSPATRQAEPPRIDDLKLINGIGPAVEKRLNGVGIITFAQLATLSPADVAAAVAGLAGLSAERIIKQDWIGQARKLAAGLLASEAPQDTVTAVEPLTPVEERAPAAEQQAEEPEQPGEVAVESQASEAQMDIEAPVVTEQIVTSTPVEPPPVSVENTHEVESMAEPEMVALPSEERYQPATFTVELLLDENYSVFSTRALHIQSRREQTWTGWQETQLVDFLSDSAGLNITPEESAFSGAEAADHTSMVVAASEPLTSIAASEQGVGPNIVPEEPALPGTETSGHAHVVATKSRQLTPITESSRLAGTLRIHDIETLRAGSNIPSRLLASNEPFDVRLTLDLTELQMPDETSLNYKASIYGKSRGTGSHAGLVGEAQGTIIPDDTVIIKVKGNTLSEGVYRLAATVILGLPDMQLTPRPGTTATINGGRVQVY